MTIKTNSISEVHDHPKKELCTENYCISGLILQKINNSSLNEESEEF